MIYIGVDVGGTKTEVLVVNKNGEVLSRALGGPGNHESIGEEKAAAEIKRTIEKATDGLSDRKIGGAFFGMAGIDHEEDKEIAERIIKMIGIDNAAFDNDGRIALRSCFYDDKGIVIACGTGGISYSGNGKKLYRIGGFSWSFGERLGSHLIAGMVTAAAVRAVDGREYSTLLTKLLEEKLKMDAFELRRISRFGLTSVKDKVPLIISALYEAYENHDFVATKIILSIVDEVVKIAKAHKKMLKITAPVGVCLTGTFFMKAPKYIVDMAQSALGEDFEVFVSDRSPVVGAAHLALESGGIHPDKKALERIAFSYKGA